MKKSVKFPNDRIVTALGIGTWHMGEDNTRRSAEISALDIELTDNELSILDGYYPEPIRKQPLDMI